ncbi:MAG: PLP-dependent aminotransferase family protein [Proteobacteria bacterium]|nr:PLP-dependent aminotransferase family protein [Pseudomonadota bacterium]
MAPRTLAWTPLALDPAKPAYIAIADAIAGDIRDGRLAPDTRLPPQRQLAHALGLNFTTISRAYAEAQRRGLLGARVGQGTFVRPEACPRVRHSAARARLIDMSMNLPPEPDQPELLARMETGLRGLCGDINSLLRYQPFGGSPEDREAAVHWLARRGIATSIDKVLVCPGTHSVLNALLSTLVGTGGGRVCCDNITYPGIRALAAIHGVSLLGLPSDADGILPDAFERCCRDNQPAALYINPTIHNPTTTTMSAGRREAIAEIAARHQVPVIEDDPYGLLPEAPPPSFKTLLPELTYHVCGLSKTVGAGLRVAYLALPDARQLPRVSGILRAVSVMTPPISTAIATEWVLDGTAEQLVRFIREESRVRQQLAAAALGPAAFQASPDGFHLWLPLPEGWSRVSFATHLRNSGIGVVTSDAFLVGGAAVEAVRICLGGAASRDDVQHAMELVGAALSHPPAIYSSIV